MSVPALSRQWSQGSSTSSPASEHVALMTLHHCSSVHPGEVWRVGSCDRGKPVQSMNGRELKVSNLGGCFRVIQVVGGPEKNSLL